MEREIKTKVNEKLFGNTTKDESDKSIITIKRKISRPLLIPSDN